MKGWDEAESSNGAGELPGAISAPAELDEARQPHAAGVGTRQSRGESNPHLDKVLSHRTAASRRLHEYMEGKRKRQEAALIRKFGFLPTSPALTGRRAGGAASKQLSSVDVCKEPKSSLPAPQSQGNPTGGKVLQAVR